MVSVFSAKQFPKKTCSVERHADDIRKRKSSCQRNKRGRILHGESHAWAQTQRSETDPTWRHAVTIAFIFSAIYGVAAAIIFFVMGWLDRQLHAVMNQTGTGRVQKPLPIEQAKCQRHRITPYAKSNVQFRQYYRRWAAGAGPNARQANSRRRAATL